MEVLRQTWRRGQRRGRTLLIELTRKIGGLMVLPVIPRPGTDHSTGCTRSRKFIKCFVTASGASRDEIWPIPGSSMSGQFSTSAVRRPSKMGRGRSCVPCITSFGTDKSDRSSRVLGRSKIMRPKGTTLSSSRSLFHLSSRDRSFHTRCGDDVATYGENDIRSTSFRTISGRVPVASIESSIAR
jgi:hypothetical protein